MNAENKPKTDSEHLATKYGTVFCPVEKVQAEVDEDNECSACGSSNVVFDLSPEDHCFACGHLHDPDSAGTCDEAECLPECNDH
jgi:hypothetical protein